MFLWEEKFTNKNKMFSSIFKPSLPKLKIGCGLDHFYTGLQTAFSSTPRMSVTTQLLHTTGLPTHAAGMIDSSLSLLGSMGGLGMIRSSQLGSGLNLGLPQKPLPGKYNNFNSSLPMQRNGPSRSRLVPNQQATGSHSAFRRDYFSGKITHYETFRPQTNLFDPKPWESVMRLDNSGKSGVSHFNKVLDQWVYEPHVHDPLSPGKIRPAEPWEIPK